MQRQTCAITAIVLCILSVALAAARAGSVPPMMSYQGKLTSSDGQATADGDYAMTFRLFAQQDGGIALWTEPKTLHVSGGIFSTLLGSVNPLPESAFQGTTWLETQIGTNTLSPRTQIVSVGYAVRASTAETVADGAITTAKLADASVTNAKLANGSVDGLKLSSNSVGNGNLTSNCVTTSKIVDRNVTYPKLGSDVLPALASSLHARDSVFNVKDYGAVGNGTTDDTTAFQSALDAASAAGGGIVWVPTGNYKIATHINIPSHVTLEGANVGTPNETWTKGTRLLASEGSGNESGPPGDRDGCSSR